MTFFHIQLTLVNLIYPYPLVIYAASASENAVVNVLSAAIHCHGRYVLSSYFIQQPTAGRNLQQYTSVAARNFKEWEQRQK